jgi:hypothetical protein
VQVRDADETSRARSRAVHWLQATSSGYQKPTGMMSGFSRRETRVTAVAVETEET